jgi:hypothetical protein
MMFARKRVKPWRRQQAAAQTAFEKARTSVDLIRGTVCKRYEPDHEERFGARMGPHYAAGIISKQLRASWGSRPQWGLLYFDGDALKPPPQEPTLVSARLVKQGTKRVKIAVRLLIDLRECEFHGPRTLSSEKDAPRIEDRWLMLTLRLVADNVFEHEDAELLWSPDEAIREKLRMTIDRLRQMSESSGLGLTEHHTLLGVAVGASSVEVKAAWRRFAAEHHPDRGGDSELFTRGRLAYESLRALTAEMGR